MRPPISTPEREDGWIEWNGGECPLAPETRVQWQIACETREEASKAQVVRQAQHLWWGRGEDWVPGQLIAYRIVSQ